jgi:membrane protein YdbS with pleckstrin-like domain
MRQGPLPSMARALGGKRPYLIRVNPWSNFPSAISMYNRCRDLVLRWLKVPPEPHAPFGDPASLRVFRAGRNYFNLRLAGWGLAQVLALAGIIFWAVVLIQVEDAARAQKLARAAAKETPKPNATNPATVPSNSSAQNQADIEKWKNSFAEAVKSAATASAPTDKSSGRKPHVSDWAGFKQVLVQIALVLPPWAFPVIWVLKITGFTVYLVQIPFTYALRRLDYEMRWYVVTDRSLRIRTGVWNVQELTMSFANLQQVAVTQGPVQRLLGLADVRVQSAGGGPERPGQKQGESLHTGHFHGVEHATEIRDLIQERLRRFRETGLGDPDESHRATPPATTATTIMAPAGNGELLAAARELAAEARALRTALG